MNKILIVEEVPALRQHASELLRSTIPDVLPISARSSRDGLKMFEIERPPMVIMDVVMPEVSGAQAARQIWDKSPSTKILFWSQFHSAIHVRELGKIRPEDAVHGYVLKSESDDKFRHAIASVFLHSNPYIDPILRGMAKQVQSENESLTDAEFETLVDVVLGLTDRAIASRRGLTVRGVQNRLASLSNTLLQKAHCQLQQTAGMEIYNPRTRLIFEAIKRGFINPHNVDEFDKALEKWLAEQSFS